MNDNGYGVIKKLQDQLQGGRKFLWPTCSGQISKKLAEMCGMPFFKVDRSDGLRDAAAAALARTGPCLIEVDMTAIGEYPNYFPFSPRPN